MTNFENIKQNVSIDDLAKMLSDILGCNYCIFKTNICEGSCVDGIKKWLEMPMERKDNKNDK